MPTIAEQLDQARKDELLDLSLRNSLINYKTLKSRGVEIIDERPREVYQMLAGDEQAMSFLSLSEEQHEKLEDAEEEGYGMLFEQPSEEEDEEATGNENDLASRHEDRKLQTPYTSARLQKRLLGTFYRARRSIEEEGVNTLFLALGMLHWYESESSDTERRAPLLLVPVELDRSSVKGRFRVRYTGEEIGGNVSLKAFLKSNFGLSWPMPPDAEEGDIDLPTYFSEAASVTSERPRWHVDRHAVALGFFSFTRFLMYEDLDGDNWPEGQGPSDHPLIRRLLREGFDTASEQVSDDVHLDQFLAPEDTRQVVNADSSQTRAILDVKEGLNLVLQGPPGTGKSQTITNIIAEAIGQGKTVLFVSEKMAALDVVKRNLDGVGLGDACLELHSHKTSKKEVLKELQRTLSLGPPQVEDFSQKAAVLLEAREELNAYADAVNEPIGESGVRPYQAHGELVQLRETLKGTGAPSANALSADAPSFDLPAMKEWSAEQFERRNFLVEQVQSHLGEMGVPSGHPFWGSAKMQFLPAHEAEVRRVATKSADALADLEGAAEDLATELGLTAPEVPEAINDTHAAAQRVLEAPVLTGVNVAREEWHLKRKALKELLEAGRRYQELHEAYDDLFIAEAWSDDIVQTRKALSAHGEKWYRWLISDWRQAKSDLRGLCQNDLPSGHEERLEAVDAILEAQRLEQTIEEHEALGEKLFGSRWEGAGSDWEDLASIGAFVAEVHQAVQAGKLPKALLSTLADPPEEAALREADENVRQRAQAYQTATEDFREQLRFDPERRFGEGADFRSEPWGHYEGLFLDCATESARLQEIVTFNQLARDLEEESLQPLLPIAEAWEGGPDHLAEAFQRVYFNALLERAMEERKVLEQFSGSKHEQVIERFRELDEAALVHSRHQLAQAHYEGLPAKSGVGQMGVLLNECGKKQRHMPLRKLMKRAGEPIQALKPVFMMSPMSIPKYLPPDSADFDLVVFDEASQVRPVDAFGAIMRGDQCVVVGDSKQLPPTSFFSAGGGDPGHGDYEVRAGDQESILDLFRSKGAPERMLRFHYRSRHESLIAVSNKEFYDNDLFVFPSPDASREETGLVYHHLPETAYDRGGSSKNREEARIVAERVMQHARENPHRSLGVATFSTAQEGAVRDHLEKKRREDPSVEDFFNAHPDEPFFVKNLERVQGDQRDVMYISVGYGYDQNEKVTMNFGPLNRDGGERRLNVLTTRAKYRCEVFTNLRAEDIDLHRTSARGVEVLKEYLSYADTGEIDLPSPTGRGADSPFEEAVAEALRKEGYRVEHQIGASGFYIDLAVVDPERPGQYILGIECDGATYHSSRMARDRDRIRQSVLESLGWTIHRIWSTDWFRNPEDQLARAVSAIERAKIDVGEAEGGETSRTSQGDSDEDSSSEDPSSENSSSNGRTSASDLTTIERAEKAHEEPRGAPAYEEADLNIRVRGGLHEESAIDVMEWVREVVEEESPVHQEVVARRIASAAGASRVGSRIERIIDKAVDYALRKEWVEKKGDVLTDPDQTEVPIRDRSDVEGPTRDIEYVPMPEIKAAALRVAEHAYGASRDELIAEAGRLLGYSRVGSRIEAKISDALDELEEEGQLLRESGQLKYNA